MKQNREESLTLEILQAVEADSDMTQRRLADGMGVALGLANSYLRRCTRKGLVKIKQAPANRYLYYLTPQGFAEKSRLTGKYFAYSLNFYRSASESVARSLGWAAERSLNRITLGGVSELAEIASVRAHDFSIDIVGSFQPDSTIEQFIGKPVWTNVEDIPVASAVLFTSLTSGNSIYDQLATIYAADRIIVPDIVEHLLSDRGK